MATVYNLLRAGAKDFEYAKSRFSISEENAVWISFSEPGEQNTIVSNPILDKLPKLKMAIWDLKEEIEDVDFRTGKKSILGPPNKFQIAKLVNFLVKHRDKSVIVNCAAGVSRSGAVAKFCQDCLDFEWPDWCKEMASPNEVIYRDMVKFYEEKYKKENNS